MVEAEVGAVGEAEVIANNQVLARIEVEKPSVEQVAHSGARHAGEIQNSDEVHEPDMQAGVSERETRIKGKGLLVDEAFGPNVAAQGPEGEDEAIGPNVAVRNLRSTNISGEDSCDPLDVGLFAGRQSPMDSDEAISTTGPVCGPDENKGGCLGLIQVQA